MNNREIARILKSNYITSGIFVTVHAADTLPEKPRSRKPCAYVSNTHNHTQPGEHWICFYWPPAGHGEYFDSYGFEPKLVFQEFLGSRYSYNVEFLQYPFSSTCGQYVIYYIYMRALGKKPAEILSSFSEDDLLGNDILVNSTLEEIFSVDLDIFDEDFIGKQICHSYYKT